MTNKEILAFQAFQAAVKNRIEMMLYGTMRVDADAQARRAADAHEPADEMFCKAMWLVCERVKAGQ